MEIVRTLCLINFCTSPAWPAHVRWSGAGLICGWRLYRWTVVHWLFRTCDQNLLWWETLSRISMHAFDNLSRMKYASAPLGDAVLLRAIALVLSIRRTLRRELFPSTIWATFQEMICMDGRTPTGPGTWNYWQVTPFSTKVQCLSRRNNITSYTIAKQFLKQFLNCFALEYEVRRWKDDVTQQTLTSSVPLVSKEPKKQSEFSGTMEKQS